MPNMASNPLWRASMKSPTTGGPLFRSDLVRRVAQWLWQRRWQILVACLSVAVAAFATHVLLDSRAAKQGSEYLYSFDFDEERVVLIVTLAMTLGGSAVAAVIFRRRLWATVGGLLTFYFGYLRPFGERAQHPPLGPAGIKQVLIPGALPQMETVMLATALVCAAAGAAIGASFGDLVLTPLIGLTLQVWKARRLPSRERPRALTPATVRAASGLALGALVIYALARSSGLPNTVLTYGIAHSIYQLAPTSAHNGADATLHGNVVKGTYPSPALGGSSRLYYIYLPPSYDVAKTQRYPVLYMLHGAPGNAGDWSGAGSGTEDALVTEGKMRETIIVCMDGNGPIYRYSEWANSFDGRQKMEDSVAIDLVHFIDQHYRTLPDAVNRAIAGNSEGGFGAVNIALHHPEVFGEAMSTGGYFVAAGLVFGSGPRSASYRAYNSPSQYIFTPSGAHAARTIRFIICVGTSDGQYYTDGVTFYQQLQRAGAKVTQFSNSGGHAWSLWVLGLGESLPILEPPK